MSRIVTEQLVDVTYQSKLNEKLEELMKNLKN